MSPSRQLTPEQKVVAYQKRGLFAVKACPGSGKTYTVAARVERLISRWRQPHAGVAALSFTNVAWREIQIYLANEFHVPVPLAYPHYVGTIDSFINQYIFLPFGHRVMGCQSRPELTGPPHDDSEPVGTWMYWRNAECQRNACRLNDFSFDEAGALIHLSVRSHFNNCESGHACCSSLKRRFALAGYATQADANYYAMKLVRDYPEIAKAVASRFPVMIVDEAQDTSRIQTRILEALIDAGLGEVMLIGDPYQAIYEWRQAEPQLFQEKFEAWGSNSTWLTENWRSTQSICDVACRLTSSSGRISARNPDLAMLDHPVQLYGYTSSSELPTLFNDFQNHCASLGIPPLSISILTRSRQFLNEIIPGAVPDDALIPWRPDDTLTRCLASAKHLFHRGSFKESLQMLERGVYKHLTGSHQGRREDARRYGEAMGLGRWRGDLYRLLAALPAPEGRLSDWLVGANVVLAQASIVTNAVLTIKQDWRSNKYSQLTFTDVFGDQRDDQEADGRIVGTVHAAKGTSLDAVFLALKSKGAMGRQYKNLLGSALTDHEELRIVYVAVTRPRKALGIAVPAADLPQWEQSLLGRQSV